MYLVYKSVFAFFLGLLIGKLKGNIPMRVFRQYSPQMAKCIEQWPQKFADKLSKKGFISEKTLGKMKSSTGLTPHQKAEILLRAVDTGNITDESGKWLKKFCRFLAKYQSLKDISEQIRTKLGRLRISVYMCTCMTTPGQFYLA